MGTAFVLLWLETFLMDVMLMDTDRELAVFISVHQTHRSSERGLTSRKLLQLLVCDDYIQLTEPQNGSLPSLMRCSRSFTPTFVSFKSFVPFASWVFNKKFQSSNQNQKEIRVNSTLLLGIATVESSTGHMYQLAYESPGPELAALTI